MDRIGVLEDCGVATPNRTPEIARRLMHNEELSINITTAVQELEKRISPALRCEPPSTQQETKRSGDSAHSPLGEKLGMLADSQLHTLRLLKSLIERIEL